ncbi:MAG: hypothetical protein ACREI9_15475, partial [Nitrospiraceae bacterium]
NELLTGGLQTDVSPLTEAAKIRGQQEFDTATSGINERLASMGLVSSSAQTAAEARERAKLGERIGATGLEAGVSAAEAAAGRRAGAVGTELGASGQRLAATQGALEGSLGQSGQRLSGLSSAGGLQTGAAGLQLEAAQGRAGAGQSLINSQMPQFGQEMSQAPAGPVRPTTSPYMRGGSFGTARGGAAAGGRADLGDFLSNLLYGQEFTRRAAPSASSSPMIRDAGPSASDKKRENLQNAFMREQLMRLQNPAGKRTPREIGPEELGRAASSTLDPGNRLGRVGSDFLKLGQYMKFLGPEQVGAGTRTAGQGFAQMGSAVAGAAAGESASKFGSLTDAVAKNPNLASTFLPMIRQRGAAGGVPQPPLPQEHGIQELGLLNPRRQFYDEGGGVAPGMDTGEDKIPAMLRSEELVLTPELADAVTKADPFKPNPELIVALQGLAQQPLEYDHGSGEHMAAEGGRSQPLFQSW